MFWVGGRIFPCFFFFDFFFLRTHTARCKYEAASCLVYLSTSTGVRTGCQYLISLSVCVLVCNIEFVVFTDCKSCTRPICTNSRSMASRQNGLARGTCFIACRLELHAVTGLLWTPWYVLGGANFFSMLSMSLDFQIHS